MVNLTRIYTRTGDDGTTSLGDMTRTGKNDPRLKAYADVDEANCTIGVCLAGSELPVDMRALLLRIQNDLFDVGADLCTPVVDNPPYEPLRVTQPYIDFLEQACDTHNDLLEPLRSFILPGGTLAAANLHIARTVVRRAERSACSFSERTFCCTHHNINDLNNCMVGLRRETETATYQLCFFLLDIFLKRCP